LAAPGEMARDIPTPKSAPEALADPRYGADWKHSIQIELDNMRDNEVWEVARIPATRPRCVDTVWVFKVKSKKSGLIDKFKSRLCCRGFSQVYGTDYTETFAPVVRSPTLRFQLVDAVRRTCKLYLGQLDFQAAFLQPAIDGDVWLKPPPGIKVPQGYMLKLRKGMYGLKQSAHLWNKELTKLLLGLGFRQCIGDPCCFILDVSEGYITISTWVDDCVVCYSNPKQWKSVCAKLAKAYPISAAGHLDWCLNMAVCQSKERDAIELSQKKYITDIEKAFVNEMGNLDFFLFVHLATPLMKYLDFVMGFAGNCAHVQ